MLPEALTMGTACSGIGAPEEAVRPLGWRARWSAEIAGFPSRVLAARHPESTNLGDLEGLVSAPPTAVDVVVAGTPCQSFSVAGLRRGLVDPRGNLALAFFAVVGRVRPRWVVWENVPGVLSSAGGRDFGAILGALAELGYGWAYRVLDAQYFGVPQRRRRVFVVGCAGGWAGAAAVLFERESLLRNPPPGRAARPDVAGPLGAGAPGSGWRDDPDRAGAFIPEASHALTTRGGGRADPSAETFLAPMRAGGGFDATETAHTLRAAGHDASEDGAGRGTLVTHPENRANPRPGDPAPTATSTSAGRIAVAGVPPVTTRHGDPGNVLERGLVRRLTPVECERLQGFPDGYTAIEGASDAARYEALGNSMAVPVMRWLAERIGRVDAILGGRAA